MKAINGKDFLYNLSKGRFVQIIGCFLFARLCKKLQTHREKRDKTERSHQAMLKNFAKRKPRSKKLLKEFLQKLSLFWQMIVENVQVYRRLVIDKNSLLAVIFQKNVIRSQNRQSHCLHFHEKNQSIGDLCNVLFSIWKGSSLSDYEIPSSLSSVKDAL